MTAIALACFYVLFVWWVSTGLVLLLVLSQRRAVNLVVAAVFFPVSLYLLARSGTATGAAGAYVAFTAAILLWASQEIAFLTGFLTGPRPLPCPPGAQGTARVRHALGAILYHELALVASGLAVLAVTVGAHNGVGLLTFLVLWIMRLSAKLNLFLGVPVLNDEFLPRQIQFLRSYFLRGPVSALFPIAIVVSVLILSGLVTAAANSDASHAATIGYTLVATLMGLAILEHVFMLVPLPIDRLWAWSTGGRRRPMGAAADAPAREPMTEKIDRRIVTSP